MKLLTSTIARYMYAIPMVMFGLFHFMSASDMAGMLGFLPNGLAVGLVYLTGLALIAAGVSIILKKMDRLSTLLLGAFLLITILTIHVPSLMGGEQSAMPMILKDLGLAGGAFLLSGMAADAGR